VDDFDPQQPVYCLTMSAGDAVETLNAAQKRAAQYGDVLPERKGVRAGPLLVIAGAGTGKTKTIAHRVAHLVVNGVDPARILLLTFTRRAAQEMRRRALDVLRHETQDVLGSKSQALLQRLVWAGTFHSIGNRLLRHYAAQLRLDPAFTVIDRADSADLFDTLREELQLTSRSQRFPRKDTCLAIYSWRVNTQKSLHDTLEQQFPWCANWENELNGLCRAYVQRKQQYNLLDYDDLLLYWHAMMKDARLAAAVGGNFDHVLVDEYQDTNRLQGEIVRALKPDGAGVMAVGDDAQSIYSFRAAAIDNILDFPAQYSPRIEPILLSQNYRSTQGVLDAANALMADAPRQFRKHLIGARGKGARPAYVTAEDLQSQAEYVCTEILKRRETGIELRRQAVLFRNTSASDALEVELLRRKIPFIKYGGLQFLEAAHVKDLLAVLRWAENPRNTLAGFRALQLLPGMGPSNARRALDLLQQSGGSLASLAQFDAPAAAQPDLAAFVRLMVTLADPQRPWQGQVRLVREWYQPHLERIFEHVHTRIGDLDQLEQLSANYASRERFLTELTLDPPGASGDLSGKPHRDEDYLVLSTVHSAKGMEWDTVYILNLVDGSFPSEFSTGKQELVDEERRLLYVAMTRARNELHLCVPLKFMLTQQSRDGDGHVYGGRSRFVTEKLLKTVEETVYRSSHVADGELQLEKSPAVDVGNAIREMW
jgi:DNA helicase-2/ATP-dependent DNA helicase PcrA